MTASAHNPREPGRLLLKLARLLFDEATLVSVVQPAIADLQHELREAGSRGRRLRAYCQGAGAILKLIVVVPAGVTQSPVSGRAMPERAWSEDRPFVMLLTAFFVAALIVPMLFGWTATAVVSGVLLAIGLRHWHNQHPVRQADSSAWLTADINFSAIPVGGNAGGLICMIGCAVILLVGVPGFVWFLAATLAAGVMVAAALSIWHSTRRISGLRNRSLLGRV